jgi:pimeloyl-ACP methyl ester carboxylesterase
MLCLPDTWAPATVIGISLGLLAFVGLAAWRLALRRPPVLAVQSIRAGILATNA